MSVESARARTVRERLGAVSGRLRHSGVTLLLIVAAGILAWLSFRYHAAWDISVSQRASLSAQSVAVLEQLSEPAKITALVNENSLLQKQLTLLVGRYQHHKANLVLEFVFAERDPERARELGLAREGDLRVEYAGQSAPVRSLREEAITNALLALARRGERWFVFVTGHGERDPLGQSNHDWGTFGQQLAAKGFQLHHLNLAALTTVPANTAALVIAGSQVDWLPGEVASVADYLARGGNLLWIADPGSLHGLDSLSERLGVQFIPGVVVDANTRRLSLDNPAMALSSGYGRHPITEGFQLITVFPYAQAIDVLTQDGWANTPLVQTGVDSWVETSALKGEAVYDAQTETRGPLTLAAGLSRSTNAAAGGGLVEQRVVVIGDGDFLSNAFIGNGGNLELGLRIVNWLSRDDALIHIPAREVGDSTLVLSQTQLAVLGVGLLVAVPGALFLIGGVLWWRRQRR